MDQYLTHHTCSWRNYARDVFTFYFYKLPYQLLAAFSLLPKDLERDIHGNLAGSEGPCQ